MHKTIALCSSMQFKLEIVAAQQVLESAGWKVFTPELSEKSTAYLELDPEQQLLAKRTFITNHFKRIEHSDAILVLNYEKHGVPGYIGANTLMEIAVACYLEKAVYLLNPVGEQSCGEEVAALTTRVLDGTLDFLSSEQ